MIKKIQNGNGPTVAVMGGIHGNEKVGVEVVKHLVQKLKNVKGTLYLIIGNPDACDQNVRFIDTDLNRTFGPNSTETERTRELKEILSQVDYLLDIHSTIKPSVPFVYIENTPKHLELAKMFDVEYIVSSDLKVEDLTSSADNFVDLHGGIGITYESGWHKDMTKIYEAYAHAIKFLQLVGSIEIETIDYHASPKHLVIYKSEEKENDYSNFDHCGDDYVIFPKSDKNFYYLAKQND